MRQWITLTAGLVLAGCSPSEPPATTPNAPAATSPAAEPVSLPEQTEPVIEDKTAEPASKETPTPEQPAASAQELKIETLDWAQTQALVKAHPGKIVVMDLWATYCAPCLKELPGLVALQAKYPDQVHCISVCLDYDGDAQIPPSKIEPDIREVLKRMHAEKIQNILLSTSTEDLFKQIEHGSMPIVYVFDTTGKRVHAFPDLATKMGDATYERDIGPAVEALLKSQASP